VTGYTYKLGGGCAHWRGGNVKVTSVVTSCVKTVLGGDWRDKPAFEKVPDAIPCVMQGFKLQSQLILNTHS
jgi:hypothetical protein